MKKIGTTTYTVYCGNDSLKGLKRYIQTTSPKRALYILVDNHTKKYCLPLLLKHIPELDPRHIITIKAGESNKNLQTCVKVWEKLTTLHSDRHSLLINLGGGAVCDLGGFVASTYKRGIQYINIPTTLLAMVDASVGGKVGIDFDGLKNQVGLFSRPVAVFVDPWFLKSLGKRQLLCGYSEMLKHALITDASYWKKLTQKSPLRMKKEEWMRLIIRSIEIKKEIIEKDPQEKSFRKLLNFGHTIAHAIEAYNLQYKRGKVLHGEAVAWGIVAESYISFRLNHLSEARLDEIVEIIQQNFKLVPPFSDNKKIIALMKHDKKNRGKQINFSLLTNIGNATFDNYCESLIIDDALEFLKTKLY